MIPSMKLLSNYHIKLLAVTLMTIDHIACIFQLPEIYRIIGRVAFPLFAFLIYQGFLHTTNLKKYFLRLFLFGVGIELLILLANLFMPLPKLYVNIFLTLAWGLLGLILLDTTLHSMVKLSLVLLLAYIARVLNFDYSWYGVLYIVSFYFLTYKPVITFIIQLAINCLIYTASPYSIQHFSLLSWLIILLYNGESGGKTKWKYVFYLYYPLHLAILYLIRMVI
jgi:hypothetical protein